MAENLVNFFLNIFSSISTTELGKTITTFIISLMPILELRGGLIAARLLNMDPVKGFIVCFIGNILPIPFILMLITPLFNKLKKTKLLKGIVEKIERKANSKKGQIEKYKYWGLLLFVGIPLPGTGAWTGSLIACMLNMDKKKSFLYVTAGVIMAGIIMLLITYGIF